MFPLPLFKIEWGDDDHAQGRIAQEHGLINYNLQVSVLVKFCSTEKNFTLIKFTNNYK
jgi:hypothetical protein